MDTHYVRRRPAAAESSSLSSRPTSLRPWRWYWESPQEHTRPLLKTVDIVAPLTGAILTVFHHYEAPYHGAPEHPYNIELHDAVVTEHPPLDDDFDWIIMDPETMQKLEPDYEQITSNKVYAMMVRIELPPQEEWWPEGWTDDEW